jgi:transposase InsO family protein
MVVHREARCVPKRPNEAWSLDFIHDQLSNGTKFRALTVVDIYSREGLAIEVGHRLKGEHVVEVLNRLVRQRGAPKVLFADNGVQFAARKQDIWDIQHIFNRVCDEHDIKHKLTEVNHPWTNGQVERMNRTIKEATVKRFITIAMSSSAPTCGFSPMLTIMPAASRRYAASHPTNSSIEPGRKSPNASGSTRYTSPGPIHLGQADLRRPHDLAIGFVFGLHPTAEWD